MRREAAFPGEPNTIGELMTDPTPTRDEAAPADERRIDLPSGYYLFQIRPSDMTCSLHMPDGLHIGNLLAQYAGADFAAAMLASAPAPASSRVDAVSEIRRAASALINNLWVGVYSGSRTFEENWRIFERDYPGVKWLHDALKAPDLSPAATPVSEAGGEVECPTCANTGWFYSDSDLGRCGCGREPALSKPASPPVGGDVATYHDIRAQDVEAAAIAIWQMDSWRAAGRMRLIPWEEEGLGEQERFRGYADAALQSVRPHMLAGYAALSQSTSAGRGE